MSSKVKSRFNFSKTAIIFNELDRARGLIGKAVREANSGKRKKGGIQMHCGNSPQDRCNQKEARCNYVLRCLVSPGV